MTTVYRPKKIGFKSMALAVTPLLLLLLVFALSTAHGVLSIVKGLGFIVVFLLLFILIAFGFTYVVLTDNKLKIVKFFIFRNSIDIQKIKSLKYRAFGTKSLDGINIEYTTGTGVHRSAILGSIGAYGQEQISKIVSHIIKSNHAVLVEDKVRSLAGN